MGTEKGLLGPSVGPSPLGGRAIVDTPAPPVAREIIRPTHRYSQARQKISRRLP